ncbi:MAG: uroporphyrinogen decarboxylase [Alphaproteobacteria bacterium]
MNRTHSDVLIVRVLRRERSQRVPVWLMRQAGRYLPEYRRLRDQAASILDLFYTPELAVEATLQPIRRFELDAAILFSDILVVPHALGQEVQFWAGDGPVLTPLRSIADLPRLTDSGFHDRLAPVYEAASVVKGCLPTGTALIGFAGSPWTVATYMVEGGTSRDFVRVKGWAASDPIGFRQLIDRLVTATAKHLIAQIRAGADLVQLFDTHAGVLPEEAFRSLVVRPTRAIVQMVRDACPGVPVIGFPRGAGVMYGEYAAETGVDGVGIDSVVPLSWAAGVLQPLVAVQGSLDPAWLVAGGSAMRVATANILKELGNGPLIFNLGHGVLPATPPEHVSELISMIRSSS